MILRRGLQNIGRQGNFSSGPTGPYCSLMSFFVIFLLDFFKSLKFSVLSTCNPTLVATPGKIFEFLFFLII